MHKHLRWILTHRHVLNNPPDSEPEYIEYRLRVDEGLSFVRNKTSTICL